jgi:two-component sensor histidine kinase
MRITGRSLAEMREAERHIPRSSGSEHRKTTDASGDAPRQDWHEVLLTAKDGRLLVLSWATVELADGSSIGIGRDITHLKRADAVTAERSARTEARNQRLEHAMRETNHRVRNELQTLAALLDMQVMSHRESVPVRELNQIRTHISTLAIIHDLLVAPVQEHRAVRSVSSKAALLQLLPMLQRCVGERRIRWSADDAQFPVKQGMSLAVLVNELVHNAVKHGAMQVDLRLAIVEQRVILEVCDDGPGFSETFDPGTAAHFGLELVETVGRIDLGGETSCVNRPEGGACVSVTFPLPMFPGASAA